jgi:hypothetical protein
MLVTAGHCSSLLVNGLQALHGIHAVGLLHVQVFLSQQRTR